ncbi:MAG: hypothetical protein NTX11_02000 [Candidatus Saccharibacteria bacterium]|nr:hypothetical protein [Candidatus Saccharibacteria bacterium]
MNEQKKPSWRNSILWRAIVASLFSFGAFASVLSLIRHPEDIGTNVVAVVFTGISATYYWYQVALLFKRSHDQSGTKAGTPEKRKSTSMAIVGIICATLVLIAMLGAWTYTQRQNIAQKDRQLQQERVLKEQEIKAKIDAARIDCRSKSRYNSGCEW